MTTATSKAWVRGEARNLLLACRTPQDFEAVVATAQTILPDPDRRTVLSVLAFVAEKTLYEVGEGDLTHFSRADALRAIGLTFDALNHRRDHAL